jgi:hypothetical protein
VLHAGVSLSECHELIDREANVLCYLANQSRRDFAATVIGDGSATTVHMPKLLVRSTLTDLEEAEGLEDCDDDTWP